MKKLRFCVITVLILALLSGICLLSIGAAEYRGALTEKTDWNSRSGWLLKECPAGVWMEYLGSSDSKEGLSYKGSLSDFTELSYYVKFSHDATVVDCNTIVLRQKNGEGKYMIRIKGCNGDVMVQAQYYDGNDWHTVIDETDWELNIGNTVCINLAREGNDLQLTIRNGIETVFAFDTFTLNEALLRDGYDLYLGCEEGNLAMTNVRIFGE